MMSHNAILGKPSRWCSLLAVFATVLVLGACENGDITAVGAGGLTLSWVAPVERADGTPLSPGEIAGYRVYYSATEGDYRYSDSLYINSRGGSVDSASVPATLPIERPVYVVMTTVDVDGRESAFSSPPLEVP